MSARDPMECEALEVSTRASWGWFMPAGFCFSVALTRFDGEQPEPFFVMDAEQVADLIERFAPERVELHCASWEREDELRELLGLAPKGMVH